MDFLPLFLEQNAQNFSKLDQVIFINDNSDDNTYHFLQDSVQVNSNFVVINNSDSGLVSALNLGISISTNNWIARFDVDDIYDDMRIEKQIALAKDGVGAIFCDYEVIDELGSSLGIITSPLTPNFCEVSLINSRRTAHPGVLLNRNAVIQVGGYKKEEYPAEDLGLWLRLSQAGYSLVSVPDLLLRYRIHSNSITSTKQVAMNEMRKYLLSQHDFSKCLNQLQHSIRKEFQLLSQEKYSHQRIFLTCLELFKTISQRNKKQELQTLKLHSNLAVEILNPNVIIAGVKYVRDGKRRRALRTNSA